VSSNHKLLSVILAGVTAASAGSNALADAEGQAAGPVTLQEVVISAQKREESLQDVPISVTVFSQEKLDLMGVGNLNGVQESTPNLTFAQQSGDQNSARVTLRGIGSETLVGGGDPGVALHIDGVYVGRNSAAALDIFDVERVEVLRGPQGTLYGRNATGGSVNILTQRPQDTPEMFGDLTIGSYNWTKARGVLNMPLNDHLDARLTLYSDVRDGYEKNLWQGGRDEGDKDSHGGRMQLLWKTDRGDQLLLRAYYTSIGGVGPALRFLGVDNPTPDGYPAIWAVGVSAGPAPPAGLPIAADVFHDPAPAVGAPVLPLPSNLLEMRKNAPEFVDQRIKGVDFDGSWQLTSNVLLRSISSYQTNNNAILVDSDNSELAIETRYRVNDAKQISQEFNLVSTANGPLTWLLGAYFYREEVTETFHVLTPAQLLPIDYPLPPGAVPGGGGIEQYRPQDYQTDSYAIFGQGTYDFTDALSITLGARQSWDHKKQSRTTGGQVDLTNGYLFLGGGAVGPLGPDSSSDKWSKLTGKAVLNYKFGPANMAYLSASTGYKAGGFDFNANTVDGRLDPYEPETVTAYEVGSKNRLLDDRLQLNLAAFYYDYTNLQTFRLTADGPRTDNAASSKIKGVEAEVVVAATDSLRLDGSLGYLDATYDKFFLDIPPPGEDLSGNRLNNAPEWTAHAGAEYTWDLNDGNSVLARLDWAYRGDVYYDRANGPFDMQKAFSLFNARLRYQAESWYVDLFGTNLTNEKYVTAELINPPFACGCRAVNIGEPRMYGITFGIRR
jgi:iron complex outermembrane receptor protein